MGVGGVGIYCVDEDGSKTTTTEINRLCAESKIDVRFVIIIKVHSSYTVCFVSPRTSCTLKVILLLSFYVLYLLKPRIIYVISEHQNYTISC